MSAGPFPIRRVEVGVDGVVHAVVEVPGDHPAAAAIRGNVLRGLSINATPLDTTPAPTRCPSCGGVMGDGDRASFGICAPCRRARRAR